MKRIYLIILMLACSLTTALAQGPGYVHMMEKTAKDDEQDKKIKSITSNLGKLNRAQDALDKEQKKMNKELITAEQNVADVGVKLDDFKQKVADVASEQKEMKPKVETMSKKIKSVDDRLKALESDISSYKASRRSIDLAYVNQQFALLSVDKLKEIRDFYASDSEMKELIDVRIELCEKLNEYNGLLQKDFDETKVFAAIDYLEDFKSSMDARSEQYQLTDAHKAEIATAYNDLNAYVEGVKIIVLTLIPETMRCRGKFGENHQAISKSMAKYLSSTAWKQNVVNIVKVPYLNNWYNNYIAELHNDSMGESVKAKEQVMLDATKQLQVKVKAEEEAKKVEEARKAKEAEEAKKTAEQAKKAAEEAVKKAEEAAKAAEEAAKAAEQAAKNAELHSNAADDLTENK